MNDELSRLEPHRFQELCAVLLQREYPGIRTPDGSGGDEGVDAWIPETQIYFQFHAPKARVQRDKVNRYLQQVAKHNPAKWVFVTNRDFTRTQWRWFEDLSKTVSFAVEAWGATKLLAQLHRHPDLRDHYLCFHTCSQEIRIQNQAADSITNIAATTVNFANRASRRKSQVVVLGVVATDPRKIGYLKYLARRYNELKEWEVGKARMRYPLIYQAYRREIKFSLAETPLERFGQACQFLQRRIDNTKIARMKGRGNLYLSFDHFIENEACPPNAEEFVRR